MENEIKNPNIIAWEKWENSLEGQQCLQGEVKGYYLKNRLWRAFMAGCESNEIKGLQQDE